MICAIKWTKKLRAAVWSKTANLQKQRRYKNTACPALYSDRASVAVCQCPYQTFIAQTKRFLCHFDTKYSKGCKDFRKYYDAIGERQTEF
jgi:hypothetical protein